VTRKDFRSTIDRILGSTTSASVLSELRSSITRLRTPAGLKRPSRDLFEIITGRSMTDTVLRRLRTATSKATRLR
jgi:hypothetical protein